ncbi:MAG: DUF2309 domain-containing protein [Planctomycetales bacterium]|nr:DUF2309 domain-containing protein [Planctomycetales bacterium]
MSVVQNHRVAKSPAAESLGRHAPAPPAAQSHSESLPTILVNVANKLAPVWPLKDYVAVNPYMGLADHDWLAARRLLQSVSSTETLMPLAHYREQFIQGQFSIDDLDAAIDELLRDGVSGAGELDSQAIAARLMLPLDSPTVDEAVAGPSRGATPTIEPLAAVVDRYAQTDWSRVIVDEIGKHCAAHYDQGQAAWASPWKHLTLFEAWRSAAACDRRMELLGISGFRQFVKQLPETPEAAIAAIIKELHVPSSLWEPLLLCAAHSVLGWASWAKYRAVEAERCGETCDDVAGLIAIRLAYDAAVSKHHRIDVGWNSLAAQLSSETTASAGEVQDDALLRNCLLRAAEIAFRRTLLGGLKSGGSGDDAASTADARPARKLARLIFCIDVRSERIRRALESSCGALETSGFAGFFGIPMEYVPWGATRGRSHVPAPLTPQFRVQEAPVAEPDNVATWRGRRSLIRALRKGAKTFQNSAVGGLGFVETVGWWSGVKMWLRALTWGANPHNGRHDGLNGADCAAFGPQLTGLDEQGVTPERLVDIAHAVLRNAGLLDNLPRLVVFCGHGSETTNNPLQAGLDCGACCGHSGEASARFAAALLNQPQVRQGLAARGVVVPADTHFTAALHNTTTDAIVFYDAAAVPATHAVEFRSLQTYASIAAGKTRLERQPTLACRDDVDLLRRSRDWSEVRPEWGLAGNAAFVVGPRSLSHGVPLDGRTFLHDYDHRRDVDGSVLELIMTAPMVVTHWINMQYYASAVDNLRFGSGSKTIHNVVGRFGVLSGGGGDLRTGLPVQSLHDGAAWRHEPLRLQVVIAAPRTAIERIVNKHAAVRDLLVNGWLHLVAVEDDRYFRYTRRQAWLPLHVEPPSTEDESQPVSATAE